MSNQGNKISNVYKAFTFDSSDSPLGLIVKSTNGNNTTLLAANNTTVYTLTLPTAPPNTAGQAIISDTNGVLSWGSTASLKIVSGLVEPFSTSTATAGALAVDLSISSLFYTTTLSGTTALTINGISSAFTSTGQSFSFSIISAQTARTAFINSLTITGATTTSLRWANNSVPTVGTVAGGFDIYQFVILRTAASAYSVLASKIAY